MDGAWNAYIFREGKISVPGAILLEELLQQLTAIDQAKTDSSRSLLVDALLRAGELESALLDAGSAQAGLIATITEKLADKLVGGNAVSSGPLAPLGRELHAPEKVRVGPPEGFAYYALHPLDYADLVRNLRVGNSVAAVIGIRSIGTTLSAVVWAALRQMGVHAERTTVRPKGHPYDRQTEFTPKQLSWIADKLAQAADFLVVDEGPGMSGSSFLSVGDALREAGVPLSRIAFLGSRDPDPASLTAPNAAVRWSAFRRYCTAPTRYLPQEAKVFIAGGIWRAHVYSDQQPWPASWLQMERLKFFSSSSDLVFKFEGYGRFGQAVHNRAIRVAEAGFGPMPAGFEEGFGIYPRLHGKVLSSADGTPQVLQLIADYCAFRAQTLCTGLPVNQHLETMLRFNVVEEFAVELPAGAAELRVERPVIADGRMSPHKWINSADGLLKVDNNIHGDDHFFPGPTDIAWDLAGAIVEWQLNEEMMRVLLDSYYRASGDNAQERIPSYLIAYSIFRTAFCKMATASMKGMEEEGRLIREYQRYRAQAQQFLALIPQRLAVPPIAVQGCGPELTIA